MRQPRPKLMSYSGMTGQMRGGTGDFSNLKPDMFAALSQGDGH